MVYINISSLYTQNISHKYVEQLQNFKDFCTQLTQYIIIVSLLVFTMSRCPDLCPDVSCQHRHFFRFALIRNGFRWNLGR